MKANRWRRHILQLAAAVWVLGSCRISVISAAKVQEMGLNSEQSGTQVTNHTGWAGLVEIEGRIYYISPMTGEKQTGWQELEGGKYYFSLETGEMQTGIVGVESERYYFQPQTGQMQTGWQEIDGGRYYFSTEDGRMKSGWQEIDGRKYYFQPQTGQMQTGWQKISGERYYFSDVIGNMLTGRQEINGSVYLFGSDGILNTSGWIKSGGRSYYSGSDGALKSGWQKIGGKKYYFSPQNYSMLTGNQKIDGSYYIFDEKGRLARSDDLQLVTVGQRIYLAQKDGTAAGGWHILKNKLYYASKTGRVKQNTSYQGIPFTGSGAAKKNHLNTKLKIKAMKVLASITKADMSSSQKLNEIWAYMSGKNFRYAVKYPDLNAKDWQRETAYDMLSTHSGNCYSFACAFAALAEEAGYKPYIICGRVRGSRDRAADGYTRHAWVRIDGKHYDPEAQFAGWLRGVYARSSYPVSHTVQDIVAY